MGLPVHLPELLLYIATKWQSSKKYSKLKLSCISISIAVNERRRSKKKISKPLFLSSSMPRSLPREIKPQEETAVAEIAGIHKVFLRKSWVCRWMRWGRMNSLANFCLLIWPVCYSTFKKISQNRFGASISGIKVCTAGIKAANQAGSVPYSQ